MGSAVPLITLLNGNRALYDAVILNLSERNLDGFVNWWTVGVKLSHVKNPKLRSTIDNTWLVHVTHAGPGDNQRAVHFLERILYEIGGVTCGEFAKALENAGLYTLSLKVAKAADQLAQPKRKLLVDVFSDHKDLCNLLVTNLGYGPTLAQFWSQVAVQLMTIPKFKDIITARWIRHIVNQNDTGKLRSEHFLKLITSDPINISVSKFVTALRQEGFYALASTVETGALRQTVKAAEAAPPQVQQQQKQQPVASKASPPLDDAYINQLVQQRVSKILADLPPAAVVVAAVPAPAPPAPAPVFNERSLECAVCLDQPRTMLLKPCNHFVVCAGCAGMINNICPLCRDKVLSMEKVYFA